MGNFIQQNLICCYFIGQCLIVYTFGTTFLTHDIILMVGSTKMHEFLNWIILSN